MPSYILAAAIKNTSDNDFIVVKQTPPPPLPEEEYQQFVDSNLWDLPSTLLKPLRNGGRCDLVIEGAESIIDKVDLGGFDVGSAIDEVLLQVGLENVAIGNWDVLKFFEEADFGPGPPVHTLYVVGILERRTENLGDSCKWISKDIALGLVQEVSKSSDRVGPFVFIGLLNDSSDSEKWKRSLTTLYQEYPPGVMLFPMRSITGEPFRTTNLVVMVPHNVGNPKSENSNYIISGDALLMDPGCCTQSHSELADLIATLPRKLVVFVTHHHYDHTDGLSIVQKCNPDSVLLAHKNTMSRIGKGTWSLGYTLISGGEKICIGGQTLEALFAPSWQCSPGYQRWR